MADEPHAVLLFDGVCNVCESTVRFVAPRDPRGHFHFASLQSEAGRRLLAREGLSPDSFDTVVLLEDGRVSVRSSALLRVVRRLRFPWPLLWALIVVPRPLRDRAYDAFAARRFRWFGRRDSCLVPDAELAARFLPDG